MIITEIRAQRSKKNRYNLYTEDGFLISLWDETIVKNSVKEGTELSEELFKKLKEEDTLKYAKELSFKYVTYSPRTEKQLLKKLENSGIDGESARIAADMMKEDGYINDAAYAREYAASCLKKYSPYVVVSRLTADGVDEKTARAAVDEANSRDNIKALFEKYERKYSALEPRMKKKRISEALARRGFSWSDMEFLFGYEED